ncbi:hypothetical protein DVS28_a3514 [Euzebya pacifica]|uniref:Uncharacterized protein n=1 Tax=Euzebya pacifica TaxID=1608957 RepID=A0A346Y140_9ACTN|nr:hypothetical protein [Euzebya pacifica]AXV08187.1 hypothetical protein DVS28_a3514 [Euzebya pacifica]
MTAVDRVTALDRAERLVLGWAQVYTRGLSADAAERRLGGLQSDCHEQRCWGDEVGASPVAVATSMVARTLAGMPADLLWRRTAHATARDRSRITRGETMRMVKTYWWLALAVVVGLLEVALGVALPLEEQNTGALIGGIVIAGLGLVSIAGIAVRRRRVVLGDLLIAGGALPVMPWLWTIVLPVLGLAVIVAALVDAANHAAVAAPDTTANPIGRDAFVLPMVGTVVACVLAAVVIGDGATAVWLVTPPVALLVSWVALRHRVHGSPLMLTGLVLISASVGSTVIAVASSWLPVDIYEDQGFLDVFVQLLVVAALVVGVVLVGVGLRRGRDRARPA